MTLIDIAYQDLYPTITHLATLSFALLPPPRRPEAKPKDLTHSNADRRKENTSAHMNRGASLYHTITYCSLAKFEINECHEVYQINHGRGRRSM